MIFWLLIFTSVSCAFVGWIGGAQRARAKERLRCTRLCESALHQRWSGSVRWVLNAIEKDKTELQSADEFFEPKGP